MVLSKEKTLFVYEKMYLTRIFEEKCEELMKAKAIMGSVHGSIGEEATSVGIAALLANDDILAPSYRDTGALLTKGLTALDLMGMLFAKECGKTRGRTRVLHVGDLALGIFPPNPLLGASSVIANGAALNFKQDGNKKIVVKSMGDGACNEGAVHEAMNFAAVNDLPIIFVIENNFYAWSTPFASNYRIKSIADRGFAYGIPGYIADGNDILDVLAVMDDAIRKVRAGNGPAIVECRTYRISGHSANDKNLYREREEIVRWKHNCPIKKFESYLLECGIASEREMASIKASVHREVDAAVETSKASPYPKPEEFFSIETMLA
jgi:TPP-dependent pyruvate/acetoin dehydrogenase alpha subunit